MTANEFAAGPLHLTATTAFGLESLVKDEVAALGYTVTQVENGRVHFVGDAAAIPRANLWLRCADRLLWDIGRFEATTFDELFEGTRALPWEAVIPKDGCFPAAKITSVKSQLFSKADGQRIVKKAVAKRLGACYRLDWLPEDGAVYPIHIRILKDAVTLSLDTSGSGLNKRGYRAHAGGAPLKETLAAALVKLSRWQPKRFFLDPLCGSGTIVIEAAMIGKNIAPGMRRHFVSEVWPAIGPKRWQAARTEAERAVNGKSFRVLGSDIDGRVLKQARSNARMAGVEDLVAFQKLPFQQVRTKRRYGVIVTNPPYGERLSDTAGVKRLYREMGAVFEKLPDWSYFILTAYPDFEAAFGRRATKNRKLYNSMLKTYCYQYFGPLPPRRGRREVIAGGTGGTSGGKRHETKA
ncbi:class I SAM-dependent RNA methyltransferase [Pseudoramibacter alactolyticus]|uniref:THUMP domain-containing class I SAM-dependent RNA methyltransferase n=1 Tax=Pseudoramibacter alactolyticus TaxID=113287 RepID=UPI0028ECB2E8|nr:class I SAM-dependent RNA methyltransferase [Pseudoramibacter alactolyticus]